MRNSGSQVCNALKSALPIGDAALAQLHSQTAQAWPCSAQLRFLFRIKRQLLGSKDGNGIWPV